MCFLFDYYEIIVNQCDGFESGLYPSVKIAQGQLGPLQI
jgi:hypothetical protein